MKVLNLIFLFTPIYAVAETSPSCPQLMQQAYRDAYTTCQTIAAQGQAPRVQSTPEAAPAPTDLQCATLLEETYRRGFLACQENIDQRQRAARDRVTGTRYVCDLSGRYSATRISGYGDVIRVTTYGNGETRVLVVATHRPTRIIQTIWPPDKCEDIAVRLNLEEDRRSSGSSSERISRR